MTEKKEVSMTFDLPKDSSSMIKVIGVGGGGSNAVNHMYRQGIRGVEFFICNTDAQALEMSPVPNKMQLGNTLTRGRGAGSNPEVGRNAAIENADELKDMLSRGTDMIFITAGMGGGTGTGAAPVIAQAAQELGILTVGIVTVPFDFEGPKRHAHAASGLAELRKYVDTILVISNDRLFEMFQDKTTEEALAEANNVLNIAAKGIAEIITVPGLINVDFEDVKTVMKNGGSALMGSAVAEGEGRARRAVQLALASPLLNDNRITGARDILLNISGSNLMIGEVREIANYVKNEAGEGTDVIFGMCPDESMEGKLSVTIIATGFEAKAKANEKVVLQLESTPANEPLNVSNLEPKASVKSPVNELPKNEPVVATRTESFSLNVKDPDEDLLIRNPEMSHLLDFQVKTTSAEQDEPMAHHPADQQLRSQKRIEQLKNMSSKFRPASVSDMEQVPAFRRREKSMVDLPSAESEGTSKWLLVTDPETKRTEFIKGNGFIEGQPD